MKRSITRIIYDIEKTREKLISLLENLTKVLKIGNRQQMNIWIESEELILVSIEDTQDVENGIAALIKLFIMRGKALFYDKLISGADWIKERPKNEIETIFRGYAQKSRIKFQFIEISQSKPKHFVLKSAIFDLDSFLKAEVKKLKK